ncbi:MAG: hypothetical protein ACTSU5_00230 [Promethearchaeota archaeon]
MVPVAKKNMKDEKEDLTTQLRAELTEAFVKKDFGLRKRANTIMTRVSHEDLLVLQSLVELEIFKSISEAAAFLIHDSIIKKGDHYNKIRKISEEIKRKKLEAVRTLLETSHEDENGEGENGEDE